MAKPAKRPIAVLLMSTLLKLGNFIFKAKYIVAQIELNNSMFPNPVPELSDVTAHIGTLEKAQLEVDKRTAGAVALRDQKYTAVLNDLRSLQGYVQDLADAQTDELLASELITASGFSLRKTGVRVKPDLKAVNSKISGKVLLTAKAAGKRVSYNWQLREETANTWADLPPTLQAKTSVSELKVGATFGFRFRAVTKTGPQNWSQEVWVVVT